MILTVTPNPSLDLLFEADELVWEDANRVEMPRRRAGGQGINLTRAANVLGGRSVALACFGGRTGAELQALLADDDVSVVSIPILAETRTFVAVQEMQSGRALLINPRGPVLSTADCVRILAGVEAACEQYKPTWLVCSGSIPRGLGEDFYALAGNVAHAANLRFVADCDGDALQRAVDAGCDLLAPNQPEAARLLGTQITTVDEAVAAARALRSVAPRVLIKLGKDGAVLCESRGCWHAQAKPVRSGSAVGAGDAFLAGFLVADESGAPPEEALRKAVAAGGAVLLGSGTELLTRTNYEKVLATAFVSAV